MPVESRDDWHCCGCGKLSPDKRRSCDCPTNVIRRGNEQAWKVDDCTDLVRRLRDIVTGPDHVIREAATRIESDAKRIAELEAERDAFQRVALDRLDKPTKAERALAEERERCARLVEQSRAIVDRETT